MAKLYNDCSNDALSFDMDYFAPLTSKKEWIPTAYEVYELIKNNRKPEIKFSICFTLETTSFPCECPETITDSLFRNVATPPSLIIFKQDNFKESLYGDVTMVSVNSSFPFSIAYYQQYEDCGEYWRSIYLLFD